MNSLDDYQMVESAMYGRRIEAEAQRMTQQKGKAGPARSRAQLRYQRES